MTLHELRHSTPSILVALGIDQRVIMQVLRHSTIILTADLYSHVASPLVRTAVEALDAALPMTPGQSQAVPTAVQTLDHTSTTGAD